MDCSELGIDLGMNVKQVRKRSGVSIQKPALFTSLKRRKETSPALQPQVHLYSSTLKDRLPLVVEDPA